MVATSEAKLVLHCGARQVTLEELSAVPTPAPAKRWHPIPHHLLVTRVKETLAEAGFTIRRESFGLSRGDARFFGVMDLEARLAEQVTLAVGIRSSIDQSFPLGFCAGSRVFCCDNLAFSSELMVRRKHTINGGQRFSGDIAAAVAKLGHFREEESARIDSMRATHVADDRADALILRAWEKGILSSPVLPQVVRLWRSPNHEEFRERTLWSLMNACTEALGPRARSNPQGFALATMRLGKHLLSGGDHEVQA